MGVRRTLRLGKHVGNTYTFKHSTHSATGLYTGTVACGLENHARAGEFCNLLVGNGTFVYGNLDEVFLGGFDTLLDSCLDFVGFAEAPANDTIVVTNHHDGGESESTATLGYLGDTVDGNQTILQFDVVGALYSVVSFCHSDN